MRIERHSSREGRVLRIYRTDAPTPEDLVAMVIALYQWGVGVIVGPSKAEHDLVFCIGPVKGIHPLRLADAIEASIRSQTSLDELAQEGQAIPLRP